MVHKFVDHKHVYHYVFLAFTCYFVVTQRRFFSSWEVLLAPTRTEVTPFWDRIQVRADSGLCAPTYLPAAATRQSVNYVCAC